jgi:NTP pyrophosphatase (non-canonical NTP hydrolase)
MNLTFEKLREVNAARGAQWDGKPAHIDDLSFRAMELGGEAGEALNVAKKLVRQLTGRVGGMDMEPARAALAEELADVVICADRVAEVLNIDLEAATIAKFNKTSRKHGLVEIADECGPHYIIVGYNGNRTPCAALTVYAASAGLDVVRENAVGMLHDAGFPHVKTADAISWPNNLLGQPHEIPARKS